MKILTPTIVLAALAGLSASRTASAAVDVVATVPDLAALVKEVGGAKVAVTALSLPTQDPHFVDAKPSLVLKLNRADLLVAVGLDLEIGWLPALQTSARNPAILSSGKGYLDCSRFVARLEIPSGAIDRSMGDIHPGGNPHYLYDPRQALACARGIAGKLAEIDAGNAKVYQANLKSFEGRLAAAKADWEKRMAPLRGRPVITYHKSWNYLLEWLGLVDVANLEPKPGIPPSPRHVAEVLKIGRERGVKVVLQESFYPDKTGRLVAGKLGGTAVSLPGGADIGRNETYIQHIDHLIAALAGAFR